MKKQFKRGLSAILSLLMIISLLPAQFALAADDDREMATMPVEYGTEAALQTSDFKGHVLNLKKVDGNANYNYEMAVQIYNMDAAHIFRVCMTYDSDDVTWVRRNGTPYASGNTAANMLFSGKVTADMISENAANYNEDDGDTPILGTNITTTLFSSSDYRITAHENVPGTTKNKVSLMTKVNPSIAIDDWTNPATGAKAEEIDQMMRYKFPINKLNTVYTMYFKLNEGKKVTADTFGMAYDTLDHFNGSSGLTLSEELTMNYVDENTYMIGFPEKEMAKQSAQFTVQDSNGSAVEGAAVKIYDEAARAGAVVTQGTTNASGNYTTDAVLDVNKAYSYTITKTGMADKSGTFTIPSEATFTVPTVTMEKASEATYSVKVTATDADTGNKLAGVQISIDGVQLSELTNTSGVATGSVKSTSIAVPLVAQKSGYETATVNVTVNPTNSNEYSVALEPERAEVQIPNVSADGADDVTITVTQTAGDKTAWGQVGSSKIYNQSDLVSGKIKLPKGNTYTLSIAATGFAPQTLTVEIDSSGNVTYKNDKNEPVDPSESLPLEKMDDPFYNVKIVKDETNPSQYNATVTLSNIDAAWGTFGIKYDKDVFTMNDFTPASEIVEFPNYGAEGGHKIEAITEDANEGYHIIIWAAKDYWKLGSSFDTRTGAKQFGTYTFTLKPGKTAADITSDAFTVMPFDKTKTGRDYLTAYADDDYEESHEFLDALWRYTDKFNDETNPYVRRLEESKATLKGFYQIYSEFMGDGSYTETEDDPENQETYDVLTTFDFEYEKSALTFVVTDEDNVPLDKADIKLYDTEGNVIDTITTDASGMVTYPVDGAAEFDYIASCKGYWDVPETDKKHVEVKDKETTTEYVVMEKKIYHTPVLDFADTSTPNKEQVKLTGNKFAYNGRDFYFNIEAETGYKITDVDFVVIVTDDDGVEHTYPKADKEGMYFLDKANIVGSPTETEPDENGFKSHDVVIKITSITVDEDDTRYTATATVGAHGQVEYTAEADEIQLPSDQTSPSTDSIVISDINPLDNKKLGKFKFTADAGYKVEKVIVNGVQINDFNDLESFEYTFDDLSMDNDITVTFYNGTPSGESVITLVVGPSGSVDVSKPETVTGVTNTRKTYVYTADEIAASNNELEFTVDAGTGTAKVQLDNGTGKTDITSTGVSGKYTVTVANNETKTVYVTFDENTIFVKTYVKSGEGTIEPLGILIKKKHDSVTVTATAATDTADGKNWSASAVDVNGKEISNTERTQPFVYTVEDIIEDTDIGAIFTEAAFVITGYIDLSQNSNITTDAVRTAPTVIFTRKDGLEVIAKDVTIDRKKSVFTVELPKGEWTVTVKKKGYITYIISGYEVAGDKNQTFGLKDGEAEENARKITPYIGNTNGTGMTVSLIDAGVVSNGLRENANSLIKGRADVDDNTKVDVHDMVYIRYNFGQRTTRETYDEFLDRTASSINGSLVSK